MEKNIISKRFTFSSAHYLPDHKNCGVLHGHNWGLEVSVIGDINEKGMVVDFHKMKEIVKEEVIGDADKNRLLDHNFLNEFIPEIVPTCENLAKWIWNKLELQFEAIGVELYCIKINETEDSYFSYYGE